MKKTFSIVLCVLLVATLFVSCAKKTSTATPVVEEKKSLLGSEPVTITFWHSGAESDGVAIDALVKKFNETNQYQITVQPIFQGQYADSLAIMMSMSAAENYSELPDIMQIATGGISAYADCEKNFTVDEAIAMFGDNIKSQYATGAMGMWQYKGEQMGLPFATSTSITYYNKDLLKKAGWDHCPDTFADVIQLSKDMKKAGLTDVVVYQDVPTTSTIAPWLGQLGSYVLNGKNGSEELGIKLDCIDNGALKTFLTEWKAMYDAGALVSGSASKNDFYAGKVAIITGTNSSVTDFLGKIGNNFEMGTSTFLRVNSSASYGATPQGSALVMFEHSDVRKAAVWEFIKFLTNAESQAEFCAATGYTPAHVDAAALPVYQEYLTTHPQQAIVSEQLAKTPASIRGCSPHSIINADFYFGIQGAVKKFLSSGMSVDEGVKLVNDTLQPLLDQVALLVE